MSIVIDREKFLVIRENEEINLPKKEFEILWLLCTVPGKVYSRKIIFENVWGQKSLSKDRTVDVHIVNLRKKIGIGFIRTIKGVGYKMMISDIQIKK